jgi:hypothetical protein
MRGALQLVALAVALVASGVGAATAPGKSAERDSSRVVLTYAYDGEEPVSVTGAYDYDRGAGILESNSERTRILMPDASYERLSEDDFWPDPDRFGRERWLKTAPGIFSDPIGVPFAGSPGVLRSFLRAATDLETVGSGVERGEQVTRYRARVYLDRLLEQFAEAEREIVAEEFRALSESWQEGLLLELAVDRERRVRRVDFGVDDYLQATVELFDYGTAVAVEAPPVRDLVSEDDLEKLMMRRLEECDRLAKQRGEEASKLVERYCPRCHA